jgi:hypothetical protein
MRIMRYRIRPALTLAATCFLGLLLATPGEAIAQPAPERAFAGQVLVSERRFPTQADSPKAFTRMIRQRATDRINEDAERQRWRIHYASFFDQPLNDLEVTIRLYDITGGERRFITSFQQFVQRRGLRSLISNITLDRGRFEPNRRILMVMENRGRVFAQGTFHIVGKVERRSGDVDFTRE